MYILLDRGMNLILETILYGVQNVTKSIDIIASIKCGY